MRPNRGFSLAELLLAFFILAIVGLLIMGLFTAGIDHYRRLDVATTVSTLTTQKMEEMMSLDIAGVNAHGGPFPAPFIDYTYQVDVTLQAGGIKQVEVAVTGPKDVTRRLKSMRAPQDIPLGMQVYLKYDCWACHTNTAVPTAFQAPAAVAPSLTTPGIAWTADDRMNSDAALKAQVIASQGGSDPEDYIKFSIRDPAAYYASGGDGSLEMPEFTPAALPEAELNAMVDWLKTLDTPGP